MTSRPDADPTDGCTEHSHRHTRREPEGGSDTLLHEDCVVFSPIVFGG